MRNTPNYNPVVAIEQVACEISEMYPAAASTLLTAATAITILLEKSQRDEQDRLALQLHWES
jgi:hypothetical protein